MFINKGDTPTIWCLLYVHDILMMSLSEAAINTAAAYFQKDFTMTITIKLSQYLGMNIKPNPKTHEVTLSMERNIQKLINMNDIKLT